MNKKINRNKLFYKKCGEIKIIIAKIIMLLFFDSPSQSAHFNKTGVEKILFVLDPHFFRYE